MLASANISILLRKVVLVANCELTGLALAAASLSFDAFRARLKVNREATEPGYTAIGAAVGQCEEESNPACAIGR